jgi:membrane protein DedA with SNARE-associated domain
MYSLLTLAGSAIWCFTFAGIGWGVGTSYQRVHEEFRWVDYAVIAAIVFVAAWLVFRHFSKRRAGPDDPAR